MKWSLTVGCVLMSCFLMIGCKDDLEDMKLSPEEKVRVIALQNPFGANLVRLENALGGTDVLIGMRGCRVYRAEPEQGVVTEWQKVKEVDNANFLAAGGCNSSGISLDSGHVYIYYCTTAIGAGGGCGGGFGHYRSVNGVDWEEQSKGKWVPVKREAPRQG